MSSPLLPFFKLWRIIKVSRQHLISENPPNLTLAEEKWMFLPRSLFWSKPLESWRFWRGFKRTFHNHILSPAQIKQVSVFWHTLCVREVNCKAKPFRRYCTTDSFVTLSQLKWSYEVVYGSHFLLVARIQMYQQLPIRFRILIPSQEGFSFIL